MKANTVINAKLVSVDNHSESFLKRTTNPEILVYGGEAVVGGVQDKDGQWVVVYGEGLRPMWHRDIMTLTEVVPLFPKKSAFVCKVYAGPTVPEDTTLLCYKYNDRYWVVKKQSDGSIVRYQTCLSSILCSHPEAAEESVSI